MSEPITRKKTKETKRVKKKEPISFIIISPCLGYKIKFNKKAPILYFGMKPAIQYYTEEIKANFAQSEIFLIAGEFTSTYKQIQSGFGIIENQLYSVTGECEQLRLGIQACSHRKIVVLKEKSIVNIPTLVDKVDQFVYINDESDGPGCILDKSNLESISFGIETNKFNGCFMIRDETISEVYDYLTHEYNKSKMLHEVVNHFIDTGFKAIR